ncbi:RNA-binding cell elongation regulator Jag/EloR [Tepidiforma thermophila]|uniref:RNA-binding protein KhpB n=1 Tax=Tepidiforma thermophila (strain KCTC 52669 / CGMCC 1.13589 / G233) TaxID=2761530 RepID=A0A2A9HDZ4_TEPT2|nr:RNA-binding cell elongation regulator Jag/EloR [Tepidiforma thermophila]PFG73351.1 putative RNA-binding protein Jag [Tepidiforma thermophila]
MDQAEASGKTVEDALKNALAILGATRDEVEVTIIDEGKKGGLFSRGRDAVVRVTRIARPAAPPASDPAPPAAEPRNGGSRPRQPRRGPQPAEGGQRAAGPAARSAEPPPLRLTQADFLRPGETAPAAPARAERPRQPARPRQERPAAPARPARPSRPSRPKEEQPHVEPDINAEEVDFAAQTIDDILRILGIDAEISIREPITPGDGRGSVLAVIDIRGDNLGVLIGRRGETLLALQFLVNLALARKYPGRGGVTVDIEHYRHRNEERIVEMARRMGDRVRQTGTPITLEPMSAAERRIVHLQFVDDPELETHSIGEGENRKVVISRRGEGG